MPDQITITISLAQAEGIVDAANCMDLAAEGRIDDIEAAYVPDETTISRDRDNYLRTKAEHAQEVADMLRPELEAALRRDPELQDVIHHIKMLRKHGRLED